MLFPLSKKAHSVSGEVCVRDRVGKSLAILKRHGSTLSSLRGKSVSRIANNDNTPLGARPVFERWSLEESKTWSVEIREEQRTNIR